MRTTACCYRRFVDDGSAMVEELSNGAVVRSHIILDLNMPRLSCFETLQVLRHNPRYNHMPIVILLTSDRSEDGRTRSQRFYDETSAIRKAESLVAQLHAVWFTDQ